MALHGHSYVSILYIYACMYIVPKVGASVVGLSIKPPTRVYSMMTIEASSLLNNFYVH